MKVQFHSLEWIKGEPGFLVQGIKGGRRPFDAVSGGNGSFIVKNESSQLNLIVKTSNNKYIQNNIYAEVMRAAGRSRMTEKFYCAIEKLCKNVEFEITDDPYTIDISSLLDQL